MNPSTLNFTQNPKYSPSGRPYVGVGGYDLGKPVRLINGMQSSPFVWIFKYTDDGSLFGFEHGYNMEFVKKWVHSDCVQFLDSINPLNLKL